MSSHELDCEAILQLKPEPEYSEDTIYDHFMTIIMDLWNTRPLTWSDSQNHPFNLDNLQFLYCPLVRAGLIEGVIDYTGEPRDVDTKTADVLLGALITYLASGYSPRYSDRGETND